MHLGSYYFYAFPPFSLIAQCLQTTEEDHALGTMVVPLWPTQPWFPVLLHLLVDQPLVLPTSSQLLYQAHTNAPHPLGLQLKLMACKVSGRVLDREIFRKQLPTFIMQSWTGTTQKQYKHYIELWSSFCCGQQTDPYDPPVGKFLDFLFTLYDKGYKYSTLNTARSAVSAIVVPVTNQTLGLHPLVSRFMKGIFKNNLPVPKYQTTWDVQIILNYSSGLPDIKDLDLKSLTIKLLMLIVLVSAQRGQSLHMLDISFMKVAETSYEFALPDHVKQSRPGYNTPSVVLKAYPHDMALCVVYHLKEYLKRTESLRKNETRVFISYVRPINWSPEIQYHDGFVRLW